MDAIYILGTGSERENEEIKYSIRSLEKYMLDLRNIYIVGEYPPFLKKAIHIPANDFSDKKEINAFSKILKACEHSDVSEEFLLMNDDFFMLDTFLGSDFPFYALKNSNGGPCGTNSFHIHSPLRIKKEWFLKMPLDKSLSSCKSPRTFYCNFFKAPPTFCTDFVLTTCDNSVSFDKQIKDKPCFSISNTLMNFEPFYKWLKNLYPIKSTFEK